MPGEMKITVCFGGTKIIVPCGSELPVRELVRQAIVRYRKVTNKVSIPKLNCAIVSIVPHTLKSFYLTTLSGYENEYFASYCHTLVVCKRLVT